MTKPTKQKETKGGVLDVNEILNTTSTEDSIIKNYVGRHANRIGKASNDKNNTYRSCLNRNRQGINRGLQS